MQKYNIAIVGATGVVGLEIIKILQQRRFPVKELYLFASDRSVGRTLRVKGSKFKVKGLRPDCFERIDIAFFSAGRAVSKKWVPQTVKSGAVVIDNTSAFRMAKDVPLVVPEVNAQTIRKHKGIIANPNCCAVPLAVVLKPLHDYARIKRVVVSTYQSVSGAGLKATYEMEQETKHLLLKRSTLYALRSTRIFPHQIAFNAIPQIPQANAFLKDGYTDEESKIIQETRKILGDNSVKVTVTCVRIPVYRGHSESVNIETARPLSPARAREVLKRARGVKVLDNPARELYPTAAFVAGKDEVFVGRIRKDDTVKNGLNLWIVGENLRKGAALNAVQIAEILTTDYHRKRGTR